MKYGMHLITPTYPKTVLQFLQDRTPSTLDYIDYTTPSRRSH